MKKFYFLLFALLAITTGSQAQNTINGHEYVDLGLPSGTLWATCNIGANSPEEAGDYFAWGETAPKSQYDSDNYSQDGYDGSEGNQELLPEDDAATVNWGSEWQMPNVKQCIELYNEKYTTTEWTTLNGVSCCKITSKSNGNSIFLPAASYSGSYVTYTDRCLYWLRETESSQQAYCMMYFYANTTGYGNLTSWNGLHIRPVRVLEEKEHEYVDLGLPSGTMWATCNVGAYIPEEYGDYFCWGEIKQKLHEAYSFNDNPRELLPENDAAAVNWGGDWRMPSLAQIEELINGDYTTTEWTTLNGVNGRKITSKSNGNSIFLPAAGYFGRGNDEGYYWSRSINTSDYRDAWALNFNSDEINKYNIQRGTDSSVRPVCFAKEVYTEFDESTGTLTYYYDGQRSYRTGKTEAYIPIGGNILDTRFNDYNDKVTKAVIDPSMKKAPLTSMRLMFDGNGYIGYVSSVGWTIISYPLSNLMSIEGLENLNTENVTDMSAMFSDCNNLQTLDLSSFNTKNVTDMSAMFSGCNNLQTLDLSSFNTKNVTDMSAMFFGCNKLQIVDVSSFDISKVTNMNNMFKDCSELTTICCSNDWSTSNATSDVMFSGCVKLVGGKGTGYNSNFLDKTYARPDGGTESPGYFTAFKRGDVNNDGEVDIADVVTVLNIMASEAEIPSADVNADNVVDIADVVSILNIMAAQ